MQPDVGLKLKDALLGEDVRDNLALASMFRPGARVEKPAVDEDEGVVEVGFEGAVAVGVDGVESGGVVYGDVVWGEADECACGAVGGFRNFEYLGI